jgi:hypothetical protein
MTMDPDHSITATIGVTKAMIRDGIEGDCSACPVAIRIYGAIPIAKHAGAGPNWLSFYLGGLRYTSATPGELVGIMAEFDGTGTCRPASAEVTFRRASRIPNAWIRCGTRREGG